MKNKLLLNSISILTSIFLTLFLLCSSITLTLNYRSLYYRDINYLNIENISGKNPKVIKENYDVLIDYLSPNYNKPLNFPSLEMSNEGRIHFEDVKNLFTLSHKLLIVSLILSIAGTCFLLHSKKTYFMKLTAILLLVLPVGLAIPFAANFNGTFTIFHKLFFSNDYWIFDPIKDPIINMLPEDYFFHCGLMILILLSTFSLVLFVLEIFIKKYFYKNHLLALSKEMVKPKKNLFITLEEPEEHKDEEESKKDVHKEIIQNNNVIPIKNKIDLK